MTTTSQQKAKRSEFTLKTTLVAAGLLLGLTLASPATAVQCGDTIGPNVTETLTGSITCDNDTAALTIVGPAAVDLTNFTILCDDANHDNRRPSGLVILGQEAKIQGGAVVGCSSGVSVEGEGSHTVENVQVEFSRLHNFFVGSSKNILRRNQATRGLVGFVTGNQSYGNRLLENVAEENNLGFGVDFGNKHQLHRNYAYANVNAGFSISGEEHTLTENKAEDNIRFGFFLPFAEKVILRQNQALRNGNVGFAINGGEQLKLIENVARLNGADGITLMYTSESKVINNVASDNNQDNTPVAFDLNDNTPNCDTNTWKDNTFGTANQPCIQ